MLTGLQTPRVAPAPTGVERAEKAPLARSGVIADIETLRGVAILLTLVAHLPYLVPWAPPLISFLADHWFGVGVDLFFVISGYVISRSLYEQLDRGGWQEPVRTLRRFWVRRAFRLLPSAWVVVALTLACSVVLPIKEPFAGAGDLPTLAHASVAAILNVFNVWGYVRTHNGQPISLLGAYWSLSLEEQFYLLFPLLVIVLTTRRRVLWLAAALIVLLFTVPKTTTADLMWWFRIDAIFWGVAIYCAYPQSCRPNAPAGDWAQFVGFLAVLTCCATMVMLVPLLSPLSFSHGTMLPFAALLVGLGGRDRGLLQFAAPVGPILNYLGTRSYGIYLLHVLAFSLIQLGVRTFLGISWTATACAFLLLIPSVVAVEVFYRTVERPSRAMGRKIAASL